MSLTQQTLTTVDTDDTGDVDTGDTDTDDTDTDTGDTDTSDTDTGDTDTGPVNDADGDGRQPMMAIGDNDDTTPGAEDIPGDGIDQDQVGGDAEASNTSLGNLQPNDRSFPRFFNNLANR